MLTVDYTLQFRKDYKLATKRGDNILLLDEIINDLIAERALHEKYKDHSLTGKYKNFRECHIKPDWLLIYQTGNGVLVLERTGSHSDLF